MNERSHVFVKKKGGSANADPPSTYFFNAAGKWPRRPPWSDRGALLPSWFRFAFIRHENLLWLVPSRLTA